MLEKIDRGEDFFDLFADDAQIYLPTWAPANERAEFAKLLFIDHASILSEITHDYAYFNYRVCSAVEAQYCWHTGACAGVLLGKKRA